MQILLDTHILLWAISDRKKLKPAIFAVIDDPDNLVFISAISLAELRIKHRIGKLKLEADLESTVIDSGFSPLPFRMEHAHWLSELPLHHRDPFDRMLIAQAAEEGLTLITSDKTLSLYPIATLIN